MTERVARLGVCIAVEPEADAAELAGQLREGLLELDTECADRATVGQAPPGTRAGEMHLVGALTQLWIDRHTDR